MPVIQNKCEQKNCICETEQAHAQSKDKWWSLAVDQSAIVPRWENNSVVNFLFIITVAVV